MTTKVKSSATSRKGRNVSECVNAASLQQVVNAAASIAAPAGVSSAGAGVASGLASPAVGAAAPVKVRQSSNHQIESAVVMEDVRLIDLRKRIAKHFAVPEWSGAAALRAALLPLVESGVMSDEQFDATCAAAARKAGVAVPVCSAARVLAVIRSRYRKEFENVCGCSFDSLLSYYQNNPLNGGALAVSFSAVLPLSLVACDSDSKDFVKSASLAAGASASGVVGAVLSYKFLAGFLAARSAAVASARAEYLDALELAARKGQRLGLSADTMCKDLTDICGAVVLTDERDIKRMRTTLARALRSLSLIDRGDGCDKLGLMYYLPCCCEVSSDGNFFLPMDITLPTRGVPAAARKLFALRSQKVSYIKTLRAMLAVAGC